jgi:hypothetical protein
VTDWRDFYSVVGEASATMVGLLFVAASVGSGQFKRGQTPALRMFLSASVVHFATTLAISAVMLAPLGGGRTLPSLVGALGLFGLGYALLTWRDALRDGLAMRIDLDDRIYYALLPGIGYLAETGAAAMLFLHKPGALATLGGAVIGLLLVAIRNAWDITVWSITRPRE